MFSTMDISTSALVAQRANLDTIAGNLANMYSTRDASGTTNPYRRRIAMFAPGNPMGGRGAAGVHVSGVVQDFSRDFRKVYDPGHPDALKSGPDAGYVRYPNVDPSTEMVNAMVASRMYEANVTVMEITKTMTAASLRVLA